MVTGSHRLNHDQAARIVSHWCERLASDFSLACNITYRPHDFAPTWDTIAIAVAPPCPRFAKPNEPVTPMLALREAIEIWHALSCCGGFGFHENPSFWKDTLRIRFQPRRSAIPLAITESFPNFVIDWDPSGDRGPVYRDNQQRELGFHLGAFFGMLGPDSTARSAVYQESLREVVPFVQSTRMKAVPIRVKLRVGLEKTGGFEFASWVGLECERIQAHLKSLIEQPDRERSALQLTGLQLVVKVPSRSADCKSLLALQALPRQIPLELVSHPLASDKLMAQRDVMPLLERVMGHVELLDLTTGVELTNLGPVCSLLPHSQSIVEVRLKVESTLGMLWVAYALFHPSTRRTKWTRLCLENEYGNDTKLQVIRRFLGSRNGSKVFRCIASSTEERLSEYPTVLGAATTEPNEELRGYVVLTARLTKRTSVYPANEPAGSRNLLASLPKGTKVELVEDDSSNLPEKVHVIVRGCGLGVVPKANLKDITTQEHPGRRTSCITALHFKSDRSNDAVATGFLEEMLPNLRHLRVTPPQAQLDRLVVQHGFPQDALTESVDGCQFTTRSLVWMQRLRHLHSLGISCTTDQLDQLHSAVRSAFTGDAARSRSPLRALRLTVDVLKHSGANWTLALPLLSATISKELKGLRVFEIAFRSEFKLHHLTKPFAAQLPLVQPGLAKGKLALLSARPQCDGALDSYVTATIFGYCGPSFERAVIVWLPSYGTFSFAPLDQIP